MSGRIKNICALDGCGKPVSSPNAKTCCRDHANKLREQTRRNSDVPEIECAYPGCSNMFRPSRKNEKYCHKTHYSYCEAIIDGKVCGRRFKVSHDRLANPGKACCRSHGAVISHMSPESRKHRIENQLAKTHGEHEWSTQRDDVKAKIRKTLDDNPDIDSRIGSDKWNKNLEDKGIKNYSQLNDVKAKKAKTSIDHYGVDNPMKDKTVASKMVESQVKKYGCVAISSSESRNRSRKSTMMAYGVPYPLMSSEIQRRIARVNEEKYGDAYYLRTDLGKQTFKNSSMRNWGVDNPMKSHEVQSALADAVERIYGCDVRNVFQADPVKKKIRSSMMSKYGYAYPMQVSFIKEKAAETFANRPAMTRLNGSVSQLNRSYASKIKSVLPDCKIRFEAPFGDKHKVMRADLLVEYNDRRLLVDFNPTISHSSDMGYLCMINACKHPKDGPHDLGKSPSYHYDRAVMASKNLLDANFMQFYQWDADDVVLAMILNKLAPVNEKYSARKLTISRIKQSEANALLAGWHSQGAARGQSYCYMLSNGNNEPVAVSTWGKPRFNESYDFEWIRYAVKPGVIIHGGQAVLMNEFIKDADPIRIISYLDYNHTTNRATFMDALGYRELKPTGPSLIWSNPCLPMGDSKPDKITAGALRRLGADRLLGTSYGPRSECGMGNDEIMLHEQYHRVYTAGNRVFEWTRGGPWS